MTVSYPFLKLNDLKFLGLFIEIVFNFRYLVSYAVLYSTIWFGLIPKVFLTSDTSDTLKMTINHALSHGCNSAILQSYTSYF